MPLTVGLLGAGMMGREHLRQFRALGAQVLVWSRSGAQSLTAQLGGTPVSSLEELLRSADVIDVTTPTTTHLEFGLAALAAGKHLICEKPLARTVADAEALAAAAASADRLLLPAHVVRWFPEYRTVKNEVDAGELGELQQLRFFRGGAYPTSPWFGDRARSGGVVVDLMIHDLDQARWLAGEVVRVEAVREEGVAAGHPFEKASVTLTHASGARSRVDGAWGAPDSRFTTEFAIRGAAGARAHSSRQPAAPGTAHDESPYLAELRDFCAAIETGARVRVSPADAVEAVRLATAALDSIDSGRPVELRSASR